MLILVFLLSMLSVQNVLLKPTVANSELAKTKEDDETRSKRQAMFFDLLHQAIEKYANCADEHLAPLKALANYKQYEAFAFPGQYYPAVRTQQEHIQPIVKCTKVNLCSIPDRHSPAELDDSIPTLYRALKIDEPNDYFEEPLGGNNHFEPRNMPSNEQINLTKTNSTHSPTSQDIFNKFSSTQITTNGNQATNNFTAPETLKDDELSYTDPPDLMKNSTLGKDSTSKPIILNLGQESHSAADSNDKRFQVVTVNPTKSESPASGKLYRVITPGKIKGCSCAKSTSAGQKHDSVSEEPTENVNAANDKDLTSKLSDSEICRCQETSMDPEWLRKLNLLFSQLDMVAHNETKVGLRQILNKLKSLKSAFQLTESNSLSCKNLTTLQDPSLVGSTVPKALSNESFAATERNRNIDLSKDVKNENSKSGQELHTTQLRNINLAQRRTLNDSIIKDSAEAVTSSPALERIKGKMKVLMSLIANRTVRYKSEEKSVNIITNNTENVAKSLNSQKLDPVNELKSNNQPAKNLSDSSVFRTARFNKNDSRITISITSKGNLKKIHVEQKLPSSRDTKKEERENENVGSPNSMVQSVGAVGTGTRHVKDLKRTQIKDAYTEPILSEMYSANLKTKPPLSIYWHKIEENPLKPRKISNKLRDVLVDLYHNEKTKAENHSTVFNEDIDEYDDKEYETEELT